MNIVLLGGLFTEPVETRIRENSIGAIQYAANKFQWAIVNGLIETKEVNLQVLTVPFISAYPIGYKKKYIGEYSYSPYNHVNIESVKFNNLWGYRNISRRRNILHAFKKINLEPNEKTILLIYSLHTPLILAAVEIKKNNPNIIVCCIVPDLPQYMNMDAKKISLYKFFKHVDMQILKKSLDVIDCYVLLTEKMRNPLNIKGKKYCVIEGIVDTNQNTDITVSKRMSDGFKKIVYTGTLNAKYGVLNLIEAFLQLNNKEIKLQICGKGQSEGIIKEYADKYPNIEYFGEVSNDESVKLQLEADILVNPRQNNEEFTKYSFPSKNMEYLLSGIPTIAYKLPGIPDEYDSYLYYVDDNSIEALSAAINEVLSWSNQERFDFGIQAKQFVLKNKNTKISAMKIIDTINNTI